MSTAENLPEQAREQARVGAAYRAAGVLVIAVGAVNGVLGVWSLLSDQFGRLATGTSVGVAAAGIATALVGVAVFRGNRAVTMVVLTVFVVLLVLQLAALGGDGLGAFTPVRLAILAALVVVLAVAVVRDRSRR